MLKHIEKKHYELAQHFFGEKQIKTAKEKADPVQYLVDWAKESITLAYIGPKEIFKGCYGYNHKGGKVSAIGLDSEGHLDFDHPLFEISVFYLAIAAVKNMYQISF